MFKNHTDAELRFLLVGSPATKARLIRSEINARAASLETLFVVCEPVAEAIEWR